MARIEFNLRRILTILCLFIFWLQMERMTIDNSYYIRRVHNIAPDLSIYFEMNPVFRKHCARRVSTREREVNKQMLNKDVSKNRLRFHIVSTKYAQSFIGFLILFIVFSVFCNFFYFFFWKFLKIVNYDIEIRNVFLLTNFPYW